MKFSPSVYEHAAKLIDRSPWEVSRNSELLFQAHAEAFRRYRHSPVVVGIDIYSLEPEAYGASITRPADNNLPAIQALICASADDICRLKEFDPSVDGRLPMVIETGKKLAAAIPEADVKIPVSGPFSIASNLMGVERLLMETFLNPDAVKEALDFIVAGQLRFCREILASDLDIAFFESSATPPLISPRMFQDVELPALKSMLEETERMIGHPMACIIGGDTAPVLDFILETGSKYVICPSETNQPTFMQKMENHPEVVVRINMDPGILVSGNLRQIHQEVDRVMSLAAGRENVCIGTGVLPYETDPNIVDEIKKYIQTNS
ncbi:MAG: uroporphyrinogen decarboxylase family protein [Candidatus Zhuqueibacterota bacterium]